MIVGLKGLSNIKKMERAQDNNNNIWTQLGMRARKISLDSISTDWQNQTGNCQEVFYHVVVVVVDLPYLDHFWFKFELK